MKRERERSGSHRPTRSQPCSSGPRPALPLRAPGPWWEVGRAPDSPAGPCADQSGRPRPPTPLLSASGEWVPLRTKVPSPDRQRVFKLGFLWGAGGRAERSRRAAGGPVFARLMRASGSFRPRGSVPRRSWAPRDTVHARPTAAEPGRQDEAVGKFCLPWRGSLRGREPPVPRGAQQSPFCSRPQPSPQTRARHVSP